MLVCQNISPQQGKHYYTDDVSFNNSQELNPSWCGKGAAALKLKSSIEPEIFQSLLSGKFSNGTRFRKLPTRSHYKQRGAIDCVFAAPKIISLLALVKGDRFILSAHNNAVDRVLELIENRYSTTRVREGDERVTLNTQNLVIAKFPHSTSRELDPHLHTHCVIINMTQTKNGKWLSLKNDLIFRHQKFLGKIYQNELAINIQKLGYQVSFNQNGQIDLKGSNRSIINAASKRLQQIRSHLSESNDSGWYHEKEAWLATRKPKQNFSLLDLRKKWKKEFSKLALLKFTLVAEKQNDRTIPQEIINKSINQAQKWDDDSYTSEAVEENILSLCPGKFSWSTITSAIPEQKMQFPKAKLTIDIVHSWRDWQQKINGFSEKQREQTLTLVADEPIQSTNKLQLGTPWFADPHELRHNLVAPFRNILILKLNDSAAINSKVRECLRRLKRTFTSCVNATVREFDYSQILNKNKAVIEEPAQHYQQWYSQLKQQVDPSASDRQRDTAIVLSLRQQHIPPTEIRKVLARSDFIHQLSKTLDERTYRQKAYQYVDSIESDIQSIAPLIKKTIKKQQIDFEL